MTSEIYISTDIEADGPIPGEYSMLSFGSVAINNEGKILGEFYKKLKPLPNAKQHPQTMTFWRKNPKAWKEATSNQEDPKKVMGEYNTWLKKLQPKNSKVIFLAMPVAMDFMFVFWYLIHFNKEYKKEFFNSVPTGWGGADIRSYAMAKLNTSYMEAYEKNYPKKWTKNTGEHTHKAIDDARKNALIFANMLKENTK
jgi:hypothetical protein